MTTAPSRPGRDPDLGPGPRPLTVTGLLLLDPHGHDPTVVESITFDDGGIGVVRSRGQAPRVLPWASVVAHAVEPWRGGVIPEWWVDPELHRTGSDAPTDTDHPDAVVADPAATNRPLPHAGAGALISIQTRTGTYRFLRSGGDTRALAARIAEFAVRHQGPAGASTVTTVAPGRYRRRGAAGGSTWRRVRPWLVVLLVLVVAAAVTLILLQSAGTIHLPFLGGPPGSGTSAPAPRPVPPGWTHPVGQNS